MYVSFVFNHLSEWCHTNQIAIVNLKSNSLNDPIQCLLDGASCISGDSIVKSGNFFQRKSQFPVDDFLSGMRLHAYTYVYLHVMHMDT